ncbi:MAG: hypothetical protein WBI45_05855 [Defluviitoga tunisiensis]
MVKEKLKLVEVKESTHKKLKLYSQLVNIPMYLLADKAINEYIKNHPVKAEKANEFSEIMVKAE